MYNLVRAGDHVTATTFRKVARDTGTGSEAERVKIRLTIAVEDVDFDPEGENGCLICLVQKCNAQPAKMFVDSSIAELLSSAGNLHCATNSVTDV